MKSSQTVSRGSGLRGWALVIACCFALPGSGAIGQESRADVGIQLETRTELTDRQKLAFADDTLRELEGHLEKVQKSADEARKRRDILLLNCLNEKLNDLKALLKVAETAYAQLQEAVGRAQDERTRHEFEKIAIARKRGADLSIESEACTGEGILSTAEGKTSISVSSNISDTEIVDVEDPFAPPEDPVYPYDASDYEGN